MRFFQMAVLCGALLAVDLGASAAQACRYPGQRIIRATGRVVTAPFRAVRAARAGGSCGQAQLPGRGVLVNPPAEAPILFNCPAGSGR